MKLVRNMIWLSACWIVVLMAGCALSTSQQAEPANRVATRDRCPLPTTISIGGRNEVFIQDATPRNGMTVAFARVV